MRLGLISDIHVDINGDYGIVDLIIRVAKEKSLDLLLIAGDISNDYKLTIKTLEKIKEKSNIDTYFIAGNHDLYDIEKKYPSTQFIYEELKNHPQSLMDKELVIKDLVFLGDIMWYDYSMADIDHYEIDHIKEKSYQNRTWQDSKYIDWKRLDEDIARDFIDSLRDRIRRLKDRGHKKIIVLTHLISHKYFLPHEYREDIGYFYAFFGSSNIGKMLMEEGVYINIMGHIHYRRTYKEKDTLFLCSCLNYFKEWQSNPKDPLKEVEDALMTIDL